MGCVECQKFLATTPLYVFNLVDFAGGGVILAYAIFLHIKVSQKQCRR
jgi:hypothetical protein